MIYLDYSATTPVNREVLESFNKASLMTGNANSLHKLGINAQNLIEASTKQITNLLNLQNKEIIYTSGSTEANNLALIGVALKYQTRGKHIITTQYEHSSVNATLDYLKTLGFEISYINTLDNGLLDLEHFKSLLRDDTILVTVNHINSELGLKMPIEEIINILEDYPKCLFHVDMTQSIGKIKVDLNNIDLVSMSAHKIYGLKGIGALIKNKNLELESLIHGGKSTTNYRSGTPCHPLIASLAKALRLSLENLDNNYNYVLDLNNYLKDNLKELKDVYINSNEYCIPHILNVSIKGVKAETFMHALEEYDVYVSTKTACSDNDSYSESVYNFTKDMERAKSSIRISLSYITTKEEIDKFIEIFKKCYNKLKKMQL